MADAERGKASEQRNSAVQKGLDPILGPELLSALRCMGHGDEIALVDANFPASSLGVPVIRLPRRLVAAPAFTQLGFGAQLRHHQIVDMHMGARADGLRRRPDDLPVSLHRFSRGNRRDGNFVSGRNRLARGDIIGDCSACGQPADRDRDVVGRVQPDDGGVARSHCVRHFVPLMLSESGSDQSRCTTIWRRRVDSKL